MESQWPEEGTAISNVRARADDKLFFDFRYQSERCREYTTLLDSTANRKLLERAFQKIEAEITLGTFDYTKTFPNSKRAAQFSAATKGEVAEEAVIATGQGPKAGIFAEEWMSEKEVCQSASKIDHPTASNFDQGFTRISCAV